MRLDRQAVRQQIENLKLLCPEAWEEGDEQLLLDMLEGETELNPLAAVLVEQMHMADAMAGGCAGYIAEIELRQKRFEQRSKARRELLFKLMSAAEVRKLELPLATLSIRNGQAKVVITDETAIDDALCVFSRSPNRTKIKELLQAGETVIGAVLSNGESYIAVRTK